MTKPSIPPTLVPWVEARRRFRLSDAHVQMARELGLNPKKLGSLANATQEPWKSSLPQFIEHLYEKSFGRSAPTVVRSIEESLQHQAARKRAKRERRLARKAGGDAAPSE